MSEGVLDIRGDAAPAAMALPTTIFGTNDGGQITAGTLTTPTVSFDQRVTDPAVTDVSIDAAFSLVTPNSLRGSIDEDRNVRLTASLRVDLTIRVAILPGRVFRCVASPVALVLEGHHDGERVQLRAPNFSVPAVPITDDCSGLITGGINTQLQGAGHSLTLDMTGELTAPLAPGEESTTTLTTSPTGTARSGEPVTLTATVNPGATAANDATPTGLVEFRDGGVAIGQADLDDEGQAELVTANLQGGRRSLSAHYLGSAPVYAVSSSPVVDLVVIARPTIGMGLPPAVVAGNSVEFGVTVRNTDYGPDLTAARLGVAIRRTRGNGAIGPAGGNPRISVSRLNGDDEIPVGLIHTGAGVSQALQGSIDPAEGTTLRPGETRRLRLRLSVASTTPLGPIQMSIILTDTTTDTVLAESTGETAIISTDRFVSTLTAGVTGLPVLARPPVTPVRARVGQTVEMYQLKPSTTIGGVQPTGTYTFSIDGKPVLVRKETGSGDDLWVAKADLNPTGPLTPVLLLPSDVGVGPQLISVSYSGDALYAPAVGTFPVTIDPPIGPAYDCAHTGTYFSITRAQIDASTVLPAAGAPPSVAFANTSLRLRLPRNSRTILIVQELATRPITGVTVELAGGGTITAEGVTLANATEMRADEPAAVDLVASLTGITGAADLDGLLGEAVDVAIASITIDYITNALSATNTIRCTPAAEPFSFGQVTVAGVDIDAPDAVASGSEVVLSAQGHPAGPGSLEFTADGRTIGHVTTTDGTGTVWTSALTGDADVVATFYPTGPFPSVSSEPHRIRIVATCAPLDEGTGATVRLVYMQLLGRCPDAAGYEYWVGQLDGGLDPGVFAARISASLEARKVIVGDAYRLLLDRAPDAAGATFWAERLGRNARYDDLLASIAASAEFRSRAGGTDAGVVARLYERIIGRAPDTAGRDYWVGVLRTRGITQVVRSFVNLPEPLAAIVTGSYQDVLDRAPTTEERTAAVDALRASGDRSALYASIIATDDFAERAQTFPELS